MHVRRTTHASVCQTGGPALLYTCMCGRAYACMHALQVRVIAPDLAARVVEEFEERRRWPRTLTVRWRLREHSFRRAGASRPLPAEARPGSSQHVLARFCPLPADARTGCSQHVLMRLFPAVVPLARHDTLCLTCMREPRHTTPAASDEWRPARTCMQAPLGEWRPARTCMQAPLGEWRPATAGLSVHLDHQTAFVPLLAPHRVTSAGPAAGRAGHCRLSVGRVAPERVFLRAQEHSFP
jgi:hypothetical protein